MQERITIEALLQSKTISRDTITLVLDVIHATAAVPGTIITTCSTQEYATYLEQCRVHANTYIIASILMDSHEQVHVQWLAVPAMTQQVQDIVSDYRRSRRLQQLANAQPTINAEPPTANKTVKDKQLQSSESKGDEPAATTREHQQVEPEPITLQLKTRDIVLAALNVATINIQHTSTSQTKGYA